MKRYIVMVIMLSGLLFAVSGEAVFKTKCASCHGYYIPQSKLNMNYQYQNKELNLTAPTLTELSFRLKDQVGDRTTDPEGQKFEIEEWLGKFLKDPEANSKTILKMQTRAAFGQMPPVKVDEDEVEALVDYIYEYAERMMVKHGVKRHTFEEARKIAKAEGKIIIIEGFIPYCRGCMWMDRNVMVEPAVKAALNKDFLLVKMNLLVEKLPLGMKRLGTPSFYFIDSDGQTVLEMVEGTGTTEEYLDLLKSVKEKMFWHSLPDVNPNLKTEIQRTLFRFLGLYDNLTYL